MKRVELNEVNQLVATHDGLMHRRSAYVDAGRFQIETSKGLIEVEKYMIGPEGDLYNAVNRAFMAFYDGQLDAIRARLLELGVELEAPSEAAPPAAEAEEAPAYVQDGGVDG